MNRRYAELMGGGHDGQEIPIPDNPPETLQLPHCGGHEFYILTMHRKGTTGLAALYQFDRYIK
jgi:hypothetical protein